MGWNGKERKRKEKKGVIGELAKKGVIGELAVDWSR